MHGSAAPCRARAVLPSPSLCPSLPSSPQDEDEDDEEEGESEEEEEDSTKRMPPAAAADAKEQPQECKQQ